MMSIENAERMFRKQTLLKSLHLMPSISHIKMRTRNYCNIMEISSTLSCSNVDDRYQPVNYLGIPFNN